MQQLILPFVILPTWEEMELLGDYAEDAELAWGDLEQLHVLRVELYKDLLDVKSYGSSDQIKDLTETIRLVGKRLAELRDQSH